MNTQYLNWISARLSQGSRTNGNPFGMCSEWTLEMQAAFPELTRIRSSVLLSNGWERDHWWLVDPSGQIVDPTASQFEQEYFGGSRSLHYAPRDESEPEPIGKCANCGEYIYDTDGWSDTTVCSDRCANAYTAYLMGGRL